MRETSIPGNLNCVYATMLGCAKKICKLEELLDKTKSVKIFCGEMISCRRKVMPQIKPNFTTRIVLNIKVYITTLLTR